MRVLVVEDEPQVRAVLGDFLKEMGHEPVYARSAEAALGNLRLERPDAVLLDLDLPGLSGLDFLRLEPVRDSGLPIVALSGVASEAQAQECLRLGAFDFMGKPVPFDLLVEILAYVEPQALYRKRPDPDAPGAGADRVPALFPVRVVQYYGPEWEGQADELGLCGMRVRTSASIPDGTAVKLIFALPDGGGMLRTMAVLARADARGHLFHFVNPGPPALRRLAEFTRQRR
jgi:CheY-like chemotaxis protein